MRKTKLILLLISVSVTQNMCNMDDIELDEDAECKIDCHVTERKITEYHANCSYRNLTEIPDNFPANVTADNITSLDLVGNLFYNLSSVSWEKFKSLQKLSLARNHIEVLEDGNFENLSKLEVLDLSMNHIRYTDISENVFKQLKALKYLDLKQTLTGIWKNETYPAALSQLPALQTLMLDGLENENLPYMPNLTELYLSGEYGRCNITILNQTFFSRVENVEYLYISNCSIRKIVNDTFGNFCNLTSLDLARNTQLGIEAVPNITYGLSVTGTIKRLNLNSLYDYITYDLCSSLEPADIEYLTHTKLEMLTLEKNYMARMADTAVKYFPQTLRYLSISDNLFMYGKYVAHMLSNSTLRHLVYFDTSKMYKTHIPVATVFPSQERALDSKLSCNKSTCIEKKTFENMCNLMLTRKNIIDDFEAMWNKMRQNGIGPAKQSVNYTDTRNQTSNACSLEYLHLSESLPGTIQMVLELFNNTPNMTFLNVSNNYLGYPLLDEHTLFKSVKNLRTLDVSNNRITKLLPDIFVNLTKLENLYLSNNRLSAVSFDLTSVKKLKHLDLSYNRVEKVNKKTRESLDKLTNVKINLAYNSLMCTCKNIHFVTWLHKNA